MNTLEKLAWMTVIGLLLTQVYGCTLRTEDFDVMCEVTITATLTDPEKELVDVSGMTVQFENTNTRETIKKEIDKLPYTIKVQKGLYQRIYMDGNGVIEKSIISGEKKSQWVRGSVNEVYLLDDKAQVNVTLKYMRN